MRLSDEIDDPRLIQTDLRGRVGKLQSEINQRGFHAQWAKQFTEHGFAWNALLPIEIFIPPHILDTQNEYIFVIDCEAARAVQGPPQRGRHGRGGAQRRQP